MRISRISVSLGQIKRESETEKWRGERKARKKNEFFLCEKRSWGERNRFRDQETMREKREENWRINRITESGGKIAFTLMIVYFHKRWGAGQEKNLLKNLKRKFLERFLKIFVFSMARGRRRKRRGKRWKVMLFFV